MAAVAAPPVQLLAQAAATEAPPFYRLGPGDQFTIIVRGQPDLSTSVVVRPDGRVSTPLIEDLYVVGMTPAELTDSIAEALSEFVIAPTVTIVVTGFGGAAGDDIRVIGEIARPAGVPYRDGMTVLDVIGQTGGLSRHAAGNNAVLLRRDGVTYTEIPLRLDDLVLDGDFGANIAVKPGDIVVVPEGFFAGEWRFSDSASISQQFTDNIDLAPEGQEKSSFLTTASYGASINGNTARMRAASRFALSVIERLPGETAKINPSLASTSQFELVRNQLFLDVNGTTSQQPIRDEQAASISPSNLVNRDLVSTFSISPSLRNRFGRIARTQTRYRASQTFASNDGFSGTTNHQLNWSLSSGPMFTRLAWSVNASASYADRSDDDSVGRGNSSASGQLKLTRSLSVTGSAGYELFDDGDRANEFRGVTWRAGVGWNPNRQSSLSLSYGRTDNADSFSGGLRHQLGAKTAIVASYSEQVQTAQEQLQQDLSFIGIDDAGGLIDRRTGLAFDPNTSLFSIDDRTTRTQQFSAAITHNSGPNTVQITAARATQRDVSQTESARINTTGSVSWSRPLTRLTNFSAQGNVQHIDVTEAGNDDQIRASLNARINHHMLANLNVSAGYAVQRQFADSREKEFLENVFTLSASMNF